MIKDTNELELPSFIETKGLEAFLLFIYSINPYITFENITEAYITSLHFKLSEFSDYILQFMSIINPKEKLFYSSLQKLEEYLRMNKERFTSDPLKNNFLLIFSNAQTSIFKDLIVKEFKQLDKDLKMELITSFQGKLEKNPFEFKGYLLKNNEFPDIKVISSGNKEFPSHSGLIYVWSEKLYNEIQDSKLILEKYDEKTVTILLDLIYKNQESDDSDFISLTKEYEINTKKRYFSQVQKTLNFVYESDFDTNGILYYIGTDFGVKDCHENPYDTGKILIQATSGYYNITGSSCDGRNTLSDILQRTQYDSRVCCTATGNDNNFFILDFQDISVFTTHVTLACSYSPNTYCSNFDYFGSIDGEGWFKIASMISNSKNIVNFDVESENNNYFRYFKIKSTNSCQLLLGGWELYGSIMNN